MNIVNIFTLIYYINILLVFCGQFLCEVCIHNNAISYFIDYIVGYMNAGILHCTYIAQTVVDWWFTTNPMQSVIHQQFLF